MLFNSLEFLIFLPTVFCLYWFVFNKNLKELELVTKSNLYSRGNSILIKSTPEKNEIVKNAIKFLLESSNCSLNEIDKIIFYEKPFLKFERLLEPYIAFSPKGFKHFSKAILIWLKKKLFLNYICYIIKKKIIGYNFIF